MADICYCGHVRDEHFNGDEPEHPQSTSCTVEGCDCIAFDGDPEASTAEELSMVDKCPKCGTELEPYAEVDIGVGVMQGGPWGCPACRWVEPEEDYGLLPAPGGSAGGGRSSGATRQMAWGDIVPLGHFATWACEPNPCLAEHRAMLESFQADGEVK